MTKAILDDYTENSRKLHPFSEGTNDVLFAEQFINGKENDHEILDYNLAISTSYSYAKDNEEGIEGPSPFRRYGAVVLDAFVDIAEDEGFDFTSNLNQYAPNVLFLYGKIMLPMAWKWLKERPVFFLIIPSNKFMALDMKWSISKRMK